MFRRCITRVMAMISEPRGALLQILLQHRRLLKFTGVSMYCRVYCIIHLSQNFVTGTMRCETYPEEHGIAPKVSSDLAPQNCLIHIFLSLFLFGTGGYPTVAHGFLTAHAKFQRLLMCTRSSRSSAVASRIMVSTLSGRYPSLRYMSPGIHQIFDVGADLNSNGAIPVI